MGVWENFILRLLGNEWDELYGDRSLCGGVVVSAPEGGVGEAAAVGLADGGYCCRGFGIAGADIAF
jgi:hypothetical protein